MQRNLLLCLLSAIFLTGCATNRTITIDTRPEDALLRIDGIDRGHGPLTETFSFANDTDTHRITASRLGFKDETKEISRDYTAETLDIEMKPQTRKINLTIFPVAADVSIDGVPVSTEAVSTVSRELPFTVDAKGAWIPHKVTVERFGFEPKTQMVSWTDRDPDYPINLDHVKKDLSISTTPTGSNVYLDDQFLGTTGPAPLRVPAREFLVDPDTNQWVAQRLRVSKPGYDPVEKAISWDDGNGDYSVDLLPKTKSLHIFTDPPGATVLLDGKPLRQDGNGVSYAEKIPFPPDEKGQLRVYTGFASVKPGEREYEPLAFSISWDDGKTDYPLKLKEILTRPVNLLEPVWEHGDDGWQVNPRVRSTLAMKSPAEPDAANSPSQIYRADKEVSIDSLDVSPDGSQVIFSVISGKDRNSFHGRLEMVHADGSGGVDYVSDGQSLDLTPSFSPGGDQIAFASDRFGKRLSICMMATNGAPGVKKITSGENNDLWPSIDSQPSPHLYYQSLLDTRSEPRLFEVQIGAMSMDDFTSAGGLQPRISPGNDAVLYCALNEKSGKREIFRLSLTDKTGIPDNLANAPEDDDYDAAWSKDGSKIAYVVQRNIDDKENPTASNPSIWIQDLRNPGKPVQLTNNGSCDDRPVWDPSGNFIYFRSNRGGAWGIWKIPVH